MNTLPVILTRSLLVVIIPGAVAILPWALLVAVHITNRDSEYAEYKALIDAVGIGLAIILGAVLEGKMTYREKMWDEEREKKYRIKENWHEYLSLLLPTEPVGYHYINRLVTTMYFELTMSAASPIFFIGLSLFFLFHHNSNIMKAIGIVWLAIGAISRAYLISEAKTTHEVLCKTRIELNKRIKEQLAASRSMPAPPHSIPSPGSRQWTISYFSSDDPSRDKPAP